MNAKSKMRVDYLKNIAEVNTTFAKMMQDPTSDEYALLQRVKVENPGIKITTRKIKSNPQKDTYKGLTYDWMREYIATHEPAEVVDAKLAAFDEMRYISQCHGKALRYPTIKNWFLTEYPDVANFGIQKSEEKSQQTESNSVEPATEKKDEPQESEPNSQNAIQMPMETAPATPAA